jgi:hypothetical protein
LAGIGRPAYHARQLLRWAEGAASELEMRRANMSTVLVEARKDPAPGEALDRIAAACGALGHRVVRWRGPLSGRVPHSRWLAACDLAILWNGAHPRYARSVAALRQRGAGLLFVELGWHPQRGMIQMDPVGINARASWAPQSGAGPAALDGTEAPCAAGQPFAVRPGGDLLVVLQLDRDTQITQLSPWFPNMRTFVEFVCAHSALPVRVRPHPRVAPDPSFRRRVVELGGTWDESPSLADALAGARALACVNSSCGVEALAAGLPVLCYGQAVFRRARAVYCLNADPAATRAATSRIAAGQAALCRHCAEATVRDVLSHQWPLGEIPQRLPALLDRVLQQRPPPPRFGWPWPFGRRGSRIRTETQAEPAIPAVG